MSQKFNAKSARAKRPCPLWVDAFQRDTQHLEADEVGAYMLILMAMWTRETCDFPHDETRLARVSRVSTRLWKSRIGPALMPFFTVENCSVMSKRLRIEAAYVEKFCQSQSERKSGSDKKSDPLAKPQGVHNASQNAGENPDNILKNNDQASTTDITTDNPPYHPTQQPNNPTYEVATATSSAQQPREASPGTDLVDDVMAAVGLTSGNIPTHWLPPGSMMHVSRWVTDLGLTPAEIIAAARSSRQQHSEPPRGPKALDGVMQSLSRAKSAGRMVPATDPRGETAPTIPRASPVPPDGAVIPSESFPETLPPPDPRFATR